MRFKKNNYTHTEKLYWPAEGYTKGDMLDYYERIAPYLLPHLRDRPLVMKRFPEGIQGFSFLQKNVEGDLPRFLKTVTIPAKTIKKNVNYIVCNNVQSLLYVANIGAIELHPWSSRIKHINLPDFMIFDLDPGPNSSFGDAIKAAQALHHVLEKKNMPSICKTSGKRGLHVYVPLHTRQPYEKVRADAKLIAADVVTQIPKVASVEHWPDKRKDKVYIEVSRNAIGQTVVAPYSLRAIPGATVSTPLEWAEVKPGLKPTRFTLKTIFDRLKDRGDL